MSSKKRKVQRLRQHLFTGRQYQLGLFQSLLPLDRNNSIDILAIYGIGGIGKSELLNQFQVLAQAAKVPVARLDAQAQTSIFDFLMSIYDQLKALFPFPNFEEGLKKHQEIEAKLLKRGDLPRTALQLFAKGTHTLLKLVPGGNIVADILSPQHIEAAVNAIYSAVGRKEGDFWMKPENELTARLLIDLNSYSAQRRLVLLIDTYELIGTFEEWVRDSLFANSGEHTLLVIAGRYRLEGKDWQEYSDLMLQVELDPFTVDESYIYLQKKGITDDQVANDMIAYADRHPLTLALLVELAGHVNVSDLTKMPERQRVIHELLERITQNVAPNLRAALEMCGILRLVNEANLAYMLDQIDARHIFNDVRHFDFVKVHSGGIALHDAVWAALNDQLCWRNPSEYHALNAKAAQFYERELTKASTQEREWLGLEWLYHHIQADEIKGIKIFQDIAEELVRYHLVNQLQVLLSDISSYNLQEEDSKLWRKYYWARLEHLKANFEAAQKMYQDISEHEQASPKLRAYALCDLGYILKISAQIDRTISVLEKSLSIVPVDAKLANGLLQLSGAFRRRGDFDKSAVALEKARDFYVKSNDKYGLIYTLNRLRYHFLNQGVSNEAFLLKKQAIGEIANLPLEPLFLKMEILGGLAIAWSWFGRLNETVKDLEEALKIAFHLGLTEEKTYYYRDIGYILGISGKYAEAESYLNQSIALSKEIAGVFAELEQATTMGFMGAVLTRKNALQEAEEYLRYSLAIKKKNQDLVGIPEVSIWLGELFEIKALKLSQEARVLAYAMAEFYYQQTIELRWTRRRYFECQALTGLIRVKYAQGDYKAILLLANEVEQLAQQYEYNDHLASLRLYQGHIVLQGHILDWGNGVESALHYYQHSLIYALRYNRFLLDVILWGGDWSTPLQSIVAFCINRGDEGYDILVALRDWWHIATNDTGVLRTNTISPIPQGISLLEAEHTARNNEPGDNSLQISVIEYIEAILDTNSGELETEL